MARSMKSPSNRGNKAYVPILIFPEKETVVDGLANKPYNCICTWIALPGGKLRLKFKNTMCPTRRHDGS